MVVSWKLKTKWQLPERIGLGIVLLSPFSTLTGSTRSQSANPSRGWRKCSRSLIVFLSAVKLLQVKKDRDWVFLYLISFEVLLAAGLSFSPIFLGMLALYLLTGLSAVTAFEIQKARRAVTRTETRFCSSDSAVKGESPNKRNTEAARLRLWR
jgi:hypothetical protein